MPESRKPGHPLRWPGFPYYYKHRKTMKPELPITLSSKYFNETTETLTTNPRTLKRLIRALRRGEGDEIRIIDNAGVRFDLIDRGRRPELLPL